jgi:hypothetical protein
MRQPANAPYIEFGEGLRLQTCESAIVDKPVSF